MSSYAELIKMAAIEAVNSRMPCNICFGTVIAIDPLVIEAEEKKVLPSEFLVVAKSLTDYKQTISFDNEDIDIPKKSIITVHAHLEVGEKVILVKAEGGQKYFVIERVGMSEE